MVDRLRAYLDRPLDPGAGRAILVLASAIFLGVGLLALLGSLDRPAGPEAGDPAPAARASGPVTPLTAPNGDRQPIRRLPGRRQDPQDRRDSGAGRRASRVLRTHRALQHVPFRQGKLTITLVGAKRGRAVLLVTAPGIGVARRGWRSFLRRYRDDGRAYLVHLRAGRGGDG